MDTDIIPWDQVAVCMATEQASLPQSQSRSPGRSEAAEAANVPPVPTLDFPSDSATPDITLTGCEIGTSEHSNGGSTNEGDAPPKRRRQRKGSYHPRVWSCPTKGCLKRYSVQRICADHPEVLCDHIFQLLPNRKRSRAPKVPTVPKAKLKSPQPSPALNQRAR